METPLWSLASSDNVFTNATVLRVVHAPLRPSTRLQPHQQPSHEFKQPYCVQPVSTSAILLCLVKVPLQYSASHWQCPLWLHVVNTLSYEVSMADVEHFPIKFVWNQPSELPVLCLIHRTIIVQSFECVCKACKELTVYESYNFPTITVPYFWTPHIVQYLAPPYTATETECCHSLTQHNALTTTQMLLYTTKLAYYGMHCLPMQAWPPSLATHSQVPMCDILLKHYSLQPATDYMRTISAAISCATVVGLVYKSAENLQPVSCKYHWTGGKSTARLQQGLHVNTVLHPVQIPACIQSYPHPIRYQYLQLLYDSTTVLTFFTCTTVLCSEELTITILRYPPTVTTVFTSTTVLCLVPVLLVFSHCVVMCHCT